jgi:C_GCAxxG_C_C family probable redox protein
MTRAEKAIELFENGANCAQAVCCAFADLMGLDEKAALRLSAPFGGGLGRQREICGAVSGMCMAAGALYGYDDVKDPVQKAADYARIQELCGKFREMYGSIICRELLGAKRADDSPNPTPRDAEFYRTRPCARFVGACADILEGYIENKG